MEIALTSGNDVVIDTPATAVPNHYYGLAGDDIIRIYSHAATGGQGNDIIEQLAPPDGVYAWVIAAYGDSPAPINVNLAEGWAEDGWGTRDTLINISNIALGGAGGSVLGTARANLVHIGGQHNLVDLGGGTDTVLLPPLPGASSFAQFAISVSSDGTRATVTSPLDPGFQATLLNVERIGLNQVDQQLRDLAEFINPADAAIHTLLAADANRWNAGAPLGTPAALTFSFAASAPASGAGAGGFRPFTDSERGAVRAILAATAAATGLSFTEVADSAQQHGQLRFGAAALGGPDGLATLPGSGDAAGSIWVDTGVLAQAAPGQQGYAVLLHEIGHALGLRHPRNGEAGDHYAEQLIEAQNVTGLSAMALTVSADGLHPSAWGAYDLAALRQLYGSRAVNPGDTVYVLGQADFQSQHGLLDDGGNDTLDASAASSGAAISLLPGRLSSVGVTAAGGSALDNLSLGVDSWIENAVGTRFDDVITGNALDNVLTGLEGNDWLDGGAGADTAVFAGPRSAYLLSSGYGKLYVAARDGASGFDTLLSMETLQFSDQRVQLGASAVGADLAAVLDQDTVLAGQLPDPSDQARSGVSYRLLQAPANGSLDMTEAGAFRYTPNPSFASADGFSYRISDQKGGSNVYQVYFSVLATGGLQAGGSGNDVLAGLDSADTIRAGAGNDVIMGSAGSDSIDGGSGNDSVRYEGARSAYAASPAPDKAGQWSVAKPGGAGADTLVGVERLIFSDGALALDLDGMAGQTYRLYQAAFDRKPDVGGLGYWLAVLDGGAGMQSVAQGFLQSGEAVTLYGANPSNAAFVDKLYQNVLHRPADDAGKTYWTGLLANGLASRETVLTGFAESPENQAQVIAAISHGIAYTPFG